MTIEIGRTLGEGIERTVSKDGLTFVAFVYVLAALGWAVVGYVPGLSPIPGSQVGPPGSGARGPAIDLPPAVTAVVVVVLLLVAVAVVAAALRIFAAGDAGRISLGDFTRNYTRTVVNLAAGWIVQTVLVGGFWLLIAIVVLAGILGAASGNPWSLFAVGLGLLLVAPALVVFEAIYFWYVAVVVEDRGFVDAFGRSWALVEGNRSSLFVLGILVWVVNTLLTGLALVPALLLPQPAGTLVGLVGTAVAGVFTLSTTAGTYVQLADDESENDGAEREESVDAARTERGTVATEAESVANER